MIYRTDLQKRYKKRIRSFAEHNVQFIQFIVSDKRIVKDEICPPTYYVKEKYGPWFSVTSEALFQIFEVGKTYLLYCDDTTILGVEAIW